MGAHSGTKKAPRSLGIFSTPLISSFFLVFSSASFPAITFVRFFFVLPKSGAVCLFRNAPPGHPNYRPFKRRWGASPSSMGGHTPACQKKKFAAPLLAGSCTWSCMIYDGVMCMWAEWAVQSRRKCQFETDMCARKRQQLLWFERFTAKNEPPGEVKKISKCVSCTACFFWLLSQKYMGHQDNDCTLESLQPQLLFLGLGLAISVVCVRSNSIKFGDKSKLDQLDVTGRKKRQEKKMWERLYDFNQILRRIGLKCTAIDPSWSKSNQKSKVNVKEKINKTRTWKKQRKVRKRQWELPLSGYSSASSLCSFRWTFLVPDGKTVMVIRRAFSSRVHWFQNFRRNIDRVC